MDTTDWTKAIAYLGGSPEEEQRLIHQFSAEIRKVVENATASHPGLMTRPQHAKQLAGIGRATFSIAETLPMDLKVGFLQPGQTYPALVRFSNAAGEVRPSDATPDLRGVAIRVFPNEGNTHDWLMTNAEEHHAKDAIEAMATTLAFAGESALSNALESLLGGESDESAAVDKITTIFDKAAGVRRLIFNIGIGDALHIVKTLSKQMKIPVESLATETFWSRAPIVIGNTAVKFLLRPQLSKNIDSPTPDDLHTELAHRLKAGPVIYDFCIQRFLNPIDTPIENARQPWKSPIEAVGSLTLLQQDIDDEVGISDGAKTEHMGFTPWNVNSPDFVPIGSMNRARKLVYESSASARHANV